MRDLFSLGVPLCYVFNLLPEPFPDIVLEANTSLIDEYAKRLAVSLFAMHVGRIGDCQSFTFQELFDPSNDGFTKVRCLVFYRGYAVVILTPVHPGHQSHNSGT